MKLSDLNKAISDTEKAQKSVAAVYGELFAKSLFAAALNQMAHSYQHLESNKKYDGMSHEEIAQVKEAERKEEIAAAQEEMKERLKIAYGLPDVAEDETDEENDTEPPVVLPPTDTTLPPVVLPPVDTTLPPVVLPPADTTLPPVVLPPVDSVLPLVETPVVS